jgi:hypothetical protein
MRFTSRLALAAALALALTGCKTKEQKESERLMPAVEALVARLPPGDPKELVRTGLGWADTLAALEEAARTGPHPPPGTPAAAKLLPIAPFIAAARAEQRALETAFQSALTGVEAEAHTALGKAVLGEATRPAAEMAEALVPVRGWPILLWHGAGDRRGFDVDQQNLPVARRAVDPTEKFVVGYVQRVDGEGVTYVTEKVTAERKVAVVALFAVPSKRRLGVFTVTGEAARLPTPVPLAGTVLKGAPPPLLENLLGSP